jgi:hypothetical protein
MKSNQPKNKWSKMMLDRSMLIIYGILFSILYGIIASGQVLGFLGAYRFSAAIILALLLTLIAVIFFFRENLGKAKDILPANGNRKAFPWLEVSAYTAGTALLVFLIAMPMLRFPYSPIGRSLTWDAGAYHFPKAVELYRSTSAWDLSIPYGDYPFGYESLLAFGLLLTGDERLFGAVHLLAGLYFCWVFWGLARRSSRLPSALLFLLSCLLLSAGTAAGAGDPILISGYALTIGKNDFLLAAAMLAIILHSPVGPRFGYKPQPNTVAQGNFQPLSLGMASMVALSIKPNAAGIVLAAWIFAAYKSMQMSRQQRSLRPWLGMLFMLLLASPGILWAIRNLVVLGVIFTPAASALQGDSIINNLMNPNLYSLNFQFVLLLAALLLCGWAWLAMGRINSISPSIAATLTLLFISFVVTPASAFQGDRSVPSHLAWRFGASLLAYCLLMLLLTFDIPLVSIFEFIKKQGCRLQIATAGIIWVFCAFILWRGFWITSYEPQNGWILRDQFAQPVGVDGDWSAYDYVQKNIRHAVIHVENGLAYYLYGPGYTNIPTKLQYPLEMADKVPQPVPDYFVIFRRDWQAGNGSGQFPASLDSDSWKQKWELIYDDGEGRVYKKRSN